MPPYRRGRGRGVFAHHPVQGHHIPTEPAVPAKEESSAGQIETEPMETDQTTHTDHTASPDVEENSMMMEEGSMMLDEDKNMVAENAVTPDLAIRTSKTYAPRQKEFRNWCDVSFPDEPIDERYIVTGEKLHAFMVQQVIGRRYKKDSNKKIKVGTCGQYVAAIVDYYQKQVRLGINHHEHPRRACDELLTNLRREERENRKRETEMLRQQKQQQVLQQRSSQRVEASATPASQEKHVRSAPGPKAPSLRRAFPELEMRMAAMEQRMVTMQAGIDAIKASLAYITPGAPQHNSRKPSKSKASDASSSAGYPPYGYPYGMPPPPPSHASPAPPYYFYPPPSHYGHHPEHPMQGYPMPPPAHAPNHANDPAYDDSTSEVDELVDSMPSSPALSASALTSRSSSPPASTHAAAPDIHAPAKRPASAAGLVHVTRSHAPTSDSIPPHYRMSRVIQTIPALWAEWHDGIDGQPSVESLEHKYGRSWRMNETDSQFFRKRRRIINALKVHARALNISEHLAIRIAEQNRLQHNRTLNTLSSNVNLLFP
ncbi:transcriptional activator of glycolytic enzymes-domain-containing protein [Gongronella butleri]|nr:transcriptional activator of glycolytic enzymes-domain-containing protein [Gongronella butleri]